MIMLCAISKKKYAKKKKKTNLLHVNNWEGV
jgi:hypothetical protein